LSWQHIRSTQAKQQLEAVEGDFPEQTSVTNPQNGSIHVRDVVLHAGEGGVLCFWDVDPQVFLRQGLTCQRSSVKGQ